MPVTPQSGGSKEDAGLFGIDLGSILKNSADSIAGIGRSITDLSATASQAESNIKSEVDAINAGGAAQQATSAIDFATLIKQQQSAAEISAWFGTNKNAASSILAGLGDKISEGLKDLTNRQKDIQGKLDANLLDNPADWLINQITVPFDQLSYTFASSNVSKNIEQATALVKLTDDTIKMNNAIESGDLAGKAKAAADLIAANTAQAAAQAQFKLKQLGLDTINVRTQLTRSQFEIVLGANNAIAQASQLRLAQLGYDLSLKQAGLAERAADRADQQLELEKQSKAIQEENLLLNKRRLLLEEEMKSIQKEITLGNQTANIALQDKLDKVAQVTGRARVTYQEYKQMSPDIRKDWDVMMANPNIVEEGRLGSTPAKSTQLILDRNLPLTPGMQVAAQDLVKIRSKTIEELSKPGSTIPWQQLKEDQKEVFLNRDILATVQKQINNIPDSGSMYSPPSAQAIFGNVKGEGGIPFLKTTNLAKGFEAIRLDDRTPLRANDVISVALNKIQNEKVSPQVMAEEISTMYRSIIVDNNANRQYQRFGLPMLDESRGFNQQITYGRQGMFAPAATTVNMADFNSVLNYLKRTDHEMRRMDPLAGRLVP